MGHSRLTGAVADYTVLLLVGWLVHDQSGRAHGADISTVVNKSVLLGMFWIIPGFKTYFSGGQTPR